MYSTIIPALTLLYIVRVVRCCPEVTLKDGVIRGLKLKSRDYRTFYAFKGIPYAKPPVGGLRFRAPQPVDPWDDVLYATEDRSRCLQKNTLFYPPTIQGDEDCLYLNVYTPKLTKFSLPKSLPVLVYIHYGGFFAGNGHSNYQGPEYFMDEDVVLVTFNYRLGLFGFLSTEDDAAPGNWALKDQTAALRWVQENIECFGGNKNQVTIFGQSAGAVSVHFHMLSPLSKGLFHKAISQSGVALTSFAKPVPGIALLVAKQEGVYVGCLKGTEIDVDTSALVNCLRDVDAQVLVKAVDNFKFFADEPSVVFMPTIETQSALNREPFLTQDPVEIIKSGNFSQVPWIVGLVQNEGLIKAGALLRQTELRNTLILNFDTYGPLLLGLSISVNSNETDLVWTAIKEFYLKNENIDVNDPQTLQGFIDMYGDRFFDYPAFRAIELHVAAGHNTIRIYSFNYEGRYSYGDLFAQTHEGSDLLNWGVSHCDDLLYLFPSRALFPPLAPLSSDVWLSKIIIRMWKDFAGNSDPRLRNGLQWSTVTNGGVNGSQEYWYLNITGSFVKNKIIFAVRNDFVTSSFYFWRNLPLLENVLFDS